MTHIIAVANQKAVLGKQQRPLIWERVWLTLVRKF